MTKKPLFEAEDLNELGAAVASTDRPDMKGMAFMSNLLDGAPKTDNGYIVYDESIRYQPGTFVRVPLDLIEPNPRNPRVFMVQADMDSLERSLRHSGQLEPVKAFYVSDTDNRLMLLNGFRRWTTLGIIQHPTIDTQIVPRPATAIEGYREARDINVESKAHSHLDDAVQFPVLMQELEMDAKTFAKSIGMAEGEVSKRLKIGRAIPKDVLEMMASTLNVFGMDASYRLAQIAEIKGEAGRDFLVDLVKQMQAEDSKISVRYLKDLYERLKSGASATVALSAVSKRNQPISRTDLKGPLTGNVRVFPNRIEANLNNLEPTLRDEVYRRMVKVFEEMGLTGPDSSAA